jgi:hypothetical protein
MADKMTADDKKWRAEQDVRTLIEAEKIKRDGGRHGIAMKQLADMKKDLESAEEDA